MLKMLDMSNHVGPLVSGRVHQIRKSQSQQFPSQRSNRMEILQKERDFHSEIAESNHNR